MNPGLRAKRRAPDAAARVAAEHRQKRRSPETCQNLPESGTVSKNKPFDAIRGNKHPLRVREKPIRPATALAYPKSFFFP
jgi:hypothetical protein